MDRQPSDQTAVVQALRDPAVHGAGCETGQVVETHAALIFLAGDTAIKIKKAVRFPYLDFSTLEKRKAALETELKINQPHAPQIYLDVVPVTCTGSGKFEIGGSGTTVEWALRMHRFPDDALLSDAVAEGRTGAEFFDRLADEIIRYHDAAPAIAGESGAQKIDAIVTGVRKAFDQAPDLLPAIAVERFADLASRQVQSCRGILNERADQGLVRRCHGDLHLGNIVVLDEQPVLFDAIEFNDDIATTDVLYDLAFLLMDLCHCHQPAYANRVLNRYLSHSRNEADLQGLKALPLFLACRAGVRAMVAITRLHQTNDHRAADQSEVLSYFGQAVSRLETKRPVLVAIGGYSGTGKTSVARRLAAAIAPCPGAVHLRTDVERKRMYKVGETTALPSECYTRQASDRVYQQVFRKAATVLRAGQCVVVDAVFLSPSERAAVEQIADNAGVSFTGLWLEADEATLIERVSARRGDASDADAEVVRLQLGMEAGDIGWRRVNAGGSLDETAGIALRTVKTDVP